MCQTFLYKGVCKKCSCSPPRNAWNVCRDSSDSDAGLGISACSPDAAIQSPLEQPQAARSTGEVVDRARDLDQLAQSIALSLESKAARHRLLASWRGSRESSDHKLSIRRYLHSSDGFELLNELAVTRRSDAAAVATFVDNLPELDFYVPFGEHRRTWRGTDDVLVAVAVDFDAPEIQAYAVDGSRRTIRLKDARFGPPVIILHAAERRPAASTASIAPRATFLQTTFVSTTNAFDDDPPPIDLECPECDGGGGGGNGGGSGGGGSPAPGIYLTTFFSHEDDGWAGDLELEFRSHAFEAAVPYWTTGSNFYYAVQCSKGTGITNYQPRTWYTNQLLLVSPGVTNVSTVSCGQNNYLRGYELHVVEMDAPGLEDDFRRRFFYSTGTANLGEPYDATLGTLQNYYAGSGVVSGSHSQVAVTLEVR